jgi:hypothetical protein
MAGITGTATEAALDDQVNYSDLSQAANEEIQGVVDTSNSMKQLYLEAQTAVYEGFEEIINNPRIANVPIDWMEVYKRDDLWKKQEGKNFGSIGTQFNKMKGFLVTSVSRLFFIDPWNDIKSIKDLKEDFQEHQAKCEPVLSWGGCANACWNSLKCVPRETCFACPTKSNRYNCDWFWRKGVCEVRTRCKWCADTNAKSGLSERCQNSKDVCGICVYRIICKVFHIFAELFEFLTSVLQNFISSIVAQIKAQIKEAIKKSYFTELYYDFMSLMTMLSTRADNRNDIRLVNIAFLEEDIQTENSALNASGNKNEALTRKLEALSKELDHANTLRKSYEQEVQRIKGETKQQLEKLRSNMSSMLKEGGEEVKYLEQHNNQLQSELELRNEKVDSLQDDMVNKEGEIDQIRAELHKAFDDSKVKTDELYSVTEQLQNLQDKMYSLQSELKRNETKYEL